MLCDQNQKALTKVGWQDVKINTGKAYVCVIKAIVLTNLCHMFKVYSTAALNEPT